MSTKRPHQILDSMVNDIMSLFNHNNGDTIKAKSIELESPKYTFLFCMGADVSIIGVTREGTLVIDYYGKRWEKPLHSLGMDDLVTIEFLFSDSEYVYKY